MLFFFVMDMFSICDRVWYLNTAECRFDSAVVRRIQVVPTGVSKDASGADVLDGSVVLYETSEGPVLTGSEVFASEAEAREFWRRRVLEI